METVPDSVKIAQKSMITHMYKIIGKLNASNFVKYDYLMNFGVRIESKVLLQQAVENACDYEEFKGYIGECVL